MKQPKHIYQLFLTLILALLAINVAAQQTRGTLSGQIVTVEHKSAENVSVALQGTRYGTLSDENGNYSFRVPAGTYILIVSHVGAQSQQIPVTIQAGQTTKAAVITINLTAGTLQQINVSDTRTNKFVKKSSDYAAKMPLSNLENPQSYSSVGKELLEEQAIYTADDAVKNVVGISKLWTATSRAGDGGAYYTLRGFPVQAQLRNGVAGNVSSTIDATDLERLEVIKGPSGTLYGSSLVSFGGLINRVTKRPYDGVGGEVSFSAGSYDFSRVSADYNTPLDSAKKALLRINTSYNYTNSFQDAGYSRSFVFAPSLSYKASDKLTFLFDAEIMHGAGTTPQILYFDYNTSITQLGVNRADQLNIDYRKSYINNDISASTDNANFFGQAEYKFSDHWKSQTNFSTNYSASNGPQSYFYLLAGNQSIARMAWSVTGSATNTQLQQNFIGDFNIGGLRNRLVVGLDFLNQRSNINFNSFSTTPTGTANFYSDFVDVASTVGAIPNYNNFNKNTIDKLYETNTLATPYKSIYNKYTTSAYASDVLNVTDNLMTMLSLRVDHFKNNAIYNPTLDNYSDTYGTPANGYSQTAVSPKFGLVYQVVKNKVSLFGNYMNGFINPGFYTAFDASTNGLTTKIGKPEQANQLEGGVKLDLFGGKLNSTISYYNISVTNLLRSDPNHVNASSQDGNQTSKGFEAEVIANPLSGLNIVAGYSHNNSVITKSTGYDEGRRPATAGSPDQANFWVSYQLVNGPAKGLGLGFGGNYASDNLIVNNSTGTFTLPAYTVFNTGAFYTTSKYRFGLNVNNLTNKEYWIGYTTVDPQMLRQYIASVSFRF